jgi:hypothetical protein
MMLVRNAESDGDSQPHFVATYISVTEESNLSTRLFNISFERQIERLWLQSRQLGWSYSDFTIHLLEVLLIRRHRDGLKRAAASKSRIAA